MVWGLENGSSLTFAGTQNTNMSDGGAKEQQQGGFLVFCQTPQTHIQTPSNPIQTQHRTIIYINKDGESYVERYNPSV